MFDLYLACATLAAPAAALCFYLLGRRERRTHGRMIDFTRRRL